MTAETREPRHPVTPVPHPDTVHTLEISREANILGILPPRQRILVTEYYFKHASLVDLRHISGQPANETKKLILEGVRQLAEGLGYDPNELHITLRSPFYSPEYQERSRLASLGREPVNKGRRKLEE